MEQYMMAEKARIMGDEDTRMQILATENPKDIKALGRLVKNFDPKKWDENKVSVVTLGNYHKFCQNEELKAFLRSTENKVLVEASPYDTIWGIGLSADAPEAKRPELWKGTNLLGFALMKIRERLNK